MSTRSNIIAHLSDGNWARIYCHFDGYLEHNGDILFNHYTGQKKVERLVALGHLSVLGRTIGVKHPFEGPPLFIPGSPTFEQNPDHARFKKRYGHMCRAYGRDRGETDIEAQVGDTLLAVWPEEDTWAEFVYVWCDAEIVDKPRDPCWWVADPDKGTQDLVNLGDALQGKITVRPAVKAFGTVIGQHSAINPSDPDHSWTPIR